MYLISESELSSMFDQMEANFGRIPRQKKLYDKLWPQGNTDFEKYPRLQPLPFSCGLESRLMLLNPSPRLPIIECACAITVNPMTCFYMYSAVCIIMTLIVLTTFIARL